MGLIVFNQNWIILDLIFRQRHVDLVCIVVVDFNTPGIAGNADDLVTRPVGKSFALEMELAAGIQTQALTD